MILAASIPLHHRIVSLALAVAVAAAVVEMIRRRKLREEYAMLWLIASGVLVVIGAFPSITFWLGRVLGISYLTIVVMAAFLFLAMIVMHFATVISRHAEHIRQLAQQVAILRGRLEGEGRGDEPSGPAARDGGEG